MLHSNPSFAASGSGFEPTNPASLSQLWAKKYVDELAERDRALAGLADAESPAVVAGLLLEGLRSVSAQAWGKTEALLSKEVSRHQIAPQLIDPWEVSKDVHYVYEKALSAYADQVAPQRLSVRISADLGRIRQKHTAIDPRVIGFVSLQFHYCGQLLIAQAPAAQRSQLEAYFKVVDDHLYMPLQRAYEAAAQYSYGDPRLKTVQQLLPFSSEIARRIVARVNQSYPTYRCYTGPLRDATVQVSSVRDVEMFQVYLWVCVLEKSIGAIQQELFPLCVMLYPTLKVRWELVRQMIHLFGVEFRDRLSPEQAQYYLPYYQALWHMFSPEVFPE